MKRHAFTLVELLVVVSIIALLVALLMPSLTNARALGRKAICANNLHQIAAAFRGRDSDVRMASVAGARPYCHPNQWPSLAMRLLPDAMIYKCPEAPLVEGSIGQYCIRTNLGGNAKLDIPFEHNYDPDGQGRLCWLMEDDDDHALWGFEDGVARDLNPGGTVDIRIRVDKVTSIGTYVSDSYEGAVPGVLSLVYCDQVVSGWEDFRHVKKGATFQMGDSGMTNYGYNVKAYSNQVAPDTIVLLDYVQRTVNAQAGQDISAELIESARHMGTINALHADGSVRSAGPTDLDPQINPDPWSP